MSMPENDLLKSPEQEDTEVVHEQNESEERSEQDESMVTIVPVLQEELGSEISRSITVIAKSVTHRGTQTVIHCKYDETKHDFMEMIINTRI